MEGFLTKKKFDDLTVYHKQYILLVGQALQGILSQYPPPLLDKMGIAKLAIAYADTIVDLLERNKV